MSSFIAIVYELFNFNSLPSFLYLFNQANFFIVNNFSFNKFNLADFSISNIKEVFKSIFRGLFNSKLYLTKDSLGNLDNLKKSKPISLSNKENISFDKKDKGKGKAIYSENKYNKGKSKNKAVYSKNDYNNYYNSTNPNSFNSRNRNRNSIRRVKKNYSLAKDYKSYT